MRTLSSPPNGYPADAGADVLMLSPPWARDLVALVPARLAAAIGATASCDELSAAEARWLFESRADDLPGMREFVACARVGAAWHHRMSDGELRRWIVDRIDAGQFVAVRRLGSENEGGPWRALRVFIQRIEELAPGGLFRSGGRHYKLLAGIDLTRVSDRDQFELASQNEARRILDEISQRNDTHAGLVALLAEARGKLSRDWRPPLEPDGLVLLRRKVTTRLARPTEIPVLTPSQMVPREEKSWIEIALVDEDGKPHTGDIELTLADGRKVRAASNAKGLLRLDGIAAGNCQVTLPDLDASSWAQK
jgi:hypothetical protein